MKVSVSLEHIIIIQFPHLNLHYFIALKFLEDSSLEEQGDEFDSGSVDSWATGKEGKEHELRDVVAVKFDEQKQKLMVLCLWKGCKSDDTSNSTYQDLEDVAQFHEGRCKSVMFKCVSLNFSLYYYTPFPVYYSTVWKTDALVNEWIKSQERVITVFKKKTKSKQQSKEEIIAQVLHKDESTSHILVGKRCLSGECCKEHGEPFCDHCLTGYYLSSQCCKGRMLMFCLFYFEL